MLNDLILAPSQACGAFRLVPLLRKTFRTDLRLGLSKESGFAVKLPDAVYIGYIPHALVVEWTNDSTPVATLGTQLKTVRKQSQVSPGVFRRMAKRQDGRRLRFLPLHLAMEGLRIVAPDGSLQYLKTFRLSAAQTRRAYLLKQLADHDWNIESIAKKYNLTANDILLQYESNGYGWLFHQHVLDAARAYTRRKP